MTKTYHTLDKEEWHKLIPYFHPIHGSHYIDLPNGRVLVATHFATEWAEEEFHNKAKTKRSLPHPVFEGSTAIADHHAEELAHLFDSPKEAQNATVHHVVRKAAAIHPMMRLSIF